VVAKEALSVAKTSGRISFEVSGASERLAALERAARVFGRTDSSEGEILLGMSSMALSAELC